MIDVAAFEIGDSFNADKVNMAIEAFDSNQLSVTEFHEKIAQAGVIYVSVYLLHKKIYYMGQDARYYLESYA